MNIISLLALGVVGVLVLAVVVRIREIIAETKNEQENEIMAQDKKAETGSHRSRSGSNLKENRTPEVVISESDLEAGVAYLKSLPWSATENMPEPWSRQRLLNFIADAISAQKIKVDDTLKITHGIWAVIKPIGIDVAGDPFAHDKRFQVWLLIRPALTDPDTFIDIETE